MQSSTDSTGSLLLRLGDSLTTAWAEGHTLVGARTSVCFAHVLYNLRLFYLSSVRITEYLLLGLQPSAALMSTYFDYLQMQGGPRAEPALPFIRPRQRVPPWSPQPGFASYCNNPPGGRRSRVLPRSNTGCWTCRTRSIFLVLIPLIPIMTNTIARGKMRRSKANMWSTVAYKSSGIPLLTGQ